MSFSLGSKKRDLSDKWHSGEDSKRLSENIDNASLLPDDAFSDDLNSLKCAKILINCLTSTELQVKNFLCFRISQIKREM